MGIGPARGGRPGRANRPAGGAGTAGPPAAPEGAARGALAAARRERDRALAACEAMARAQESFLAAAAHELRTPITTLKGTAQMGLRRLRRGEVDSARLERALAVVEAQASRLERLVAELVESAAIARGDAALAVAAVDLGDAAERAAADLRAGGVPVTYRRPAAPVRVRADAGRLALALAALFDNAARYAPGEGMEVSVDAAPAAEATGVRREAEGASAPAADPADPAGPHPGAGRLTLRVAGPGLPAVDHGLLFERAHRAASGVAQSAGGLGLFLCRQIVELHGGRVGAAQPMEGGIRFTVLLPLAESRVGRISRPDGSPSL